MSRSKKAVFIIITLVLAASLFLLINYLQSVKDYQAQVNALTFHEIDITSIPDGTYTGECDVDFIYAKVEIAIQNGKIAYINLLEHRNDRGQAAEEILTRIMEAQTIDVDTITSATNSSKVIKKAIENALLNRQ